MDIEAERRWLRRLERSPVEDEDENDDARDDPEEHGIIGPAGEESSWNRVLATSCPRVQAWLAEHDDPEQHAELVRLVSRLGPAPCSAEDPQGYEKYCAALWKHAVRAKHRKEPPPSVPSDQVARYLATQREQSQREESPALAQVDARVFLHALVHRHPNDEVHLGHTEHLGDGWKLMRWIEAKHSRLTRYFVRVLATYDTVSGITFVLSENTDGHLLDFCRRFAQTDPHFSGRLQQLLIHALEGLALLHHHGYCLHHVHAENLRYKMSIAARRVSLKWSSFGRVTSVRSYRDTRRDRFAFAVLVWQVAEWPRQVEVPASWEQVYPDRQHPIHQEFQRLSRPDHPLFPLSYVAFRFFVNDGLFPDTPRWNDKQAFVYLQEHWKNLKRPPLPVE